jgi:cytochrome b6-f complex iron-sulfur subunit
MDKDTSIGSQTGLGEADGQGAPEEGSSAPGPRVLSRRNFLKVGVGTLSTLALLEIGGAGFLFLRSRSVEGEFGGVVTAGSLDGFPPDSVTEFADNHFCLIRASDGGFLAVHNRCTHLGCTVNWVSSENQFVCPCHAATFDFYGNHASPPVPRPLDTFAVRIEDTMVMVDTSQPRRRDRFAPEQLIYATEMRAATDPSGGPGEILEGPEG